MSGNTDFVHSFHVKKHINWHMTRKKNDRPKEKQLTALQVTIFEIIGFPAYL